MFLRADAEAAKFTREFLDAGIDPDELVQITRLLGDGLSRAAEAMRSAALAAVIRPGATELEIAKASETLVGNLAPLLGPMIHDVLLLQLRHTIETEAVNSTERAEGQHLPVRGWSRSRSPTSSGSPGWVRRCRPRISSDCPSGSRT